MKAKKRPNGFTLIEILLVLSIIMTISSFPLLKLSPLVKAKKIEHFLEQLENDILFSQQYAISQNSSVKVVFTDDLKVYEVISLDTSSFLLVRNYDPEIKIVPANFTNFFTFKSSGNIDRSGTLRVQFGKDVYSIVFRLGKGRFNVTKL